MQKKKQQLFVCSIKMPTRWQYNTNSTNQNVKSQTFT